MITIRTATLQDLDAVTAVEAACFPPAEAASKDEFYDRLTYYANHFWLLFEGDTLISFVDGMVTDDKDLTDDMYARAALHNEQGAWQMIFGVNTMPSYRKKGYAGRLL
ncbi:GNAT family N-acetyltransferase [uncultured Megasphaera sp.]